MKKIYLSFFVIFLAAVSAMSQTAPCAWFTVCGSNTWDAELAANPKLITIADSVDYSEYPIDLGDGIVSAVWDSVTAVLPLNKFFTVANRRQPADAADFTGSLKVLYDIDYLYLLVTVTDNAVVIAGTGTNDRVEMEIVPYPDKCPGKATLHEQYSYWNNEGAHKMEVTLEGLVGEHSYVGTGSDIAPSAGYLGTQLDLITNATGYQFELGISFTEGMKSSLGLPFPASQDTSMGFNVAVIDRDPTDAGTYVQAAWSTTNNDIWATSLYCGILKFGPPFAVKLNKDVVYQKVSIRKNPIIDETIQLSGISEGKAIITNLSGLNATIPFNESKIDVTGLATGLYIVQIYSIKGALVATEKVVIQ